MATDQRDSTPPQFPPSVTLVRRGEFVQPLPLEMTLSDVENWLLQDAIAETDLLELFQAFIWRLRAARLPLHRASLHVGTLHPQCYGYAWNWNIADRFCNEVKVDEAVLATDTYRRSPLFRVLEYGELYQTRTDDADAVADSPLLTELSQIGITEYIAVPLHAGADYHNAATIATKQPDGFHTAQLEQLHYLLKLLALHVERHIALRISRNVMDTYLGAAAGEQVLHGTIKRGSGAPINAIIWVSDLRGFTDLADRLSGKNMIAVLNAYFDRLAGAVLAHQGDVLKYIGDGLLAVFPFTNFADQKAAAAAAFAAAEDALEALAALNAGDGMLSEIDDWRPLRSGIALHRGDVFFGNVGAPERLDFTVIGRAVNVASRIEGLSKALHRPLLISQPVAELLDADLEDLGTHALRGVATPLPLYAPLKV